MSQNMRFSESIRAVFLNAEAERKLSAKARQKLMSAIAKGNVTEEEHRLLNLLLYSVRVGRVSLETEGNSRG